MTMNIHTKLHANFSLNDLEIRNKSVFLLQLARLDSHMLTLKLITLFPPWHQNWLHLQTVNVSSWFSRCVFNLPLALSATFLRSRAFMVNDITAASEKSFSIQTVKLLVDIKWTGKKAVGLLLSL